MTIFRVNFGILLGWARLATGSVWPAALDHASFNASAWAAYFIGRAGIEYDQAHVTIAGWTGWILPLLLIVFLVLTHRLPVREIRGAPSPGTGSVPAGAGEPNTRT